MKQSVIVLLSMLENQEEEERSVCVCVCVDQRDYSSFMPPLPPTQTHTYPQTLCHPRTIQLMNFGQDSFSSIVSLFTN